MADTLTKELTLDKLRVNEIRIGPEGGRPSGVLADGREEGGVSHG
jgi:hypothetical protein